MSRFFKFSGALLICFVLANVFYLFLLPRIDWDFGKTREAHGFKGRNIKVLVFGNSTAMDGINTEMLSDSLGSAYNFSVGGATLESNYIQLKEYLQLNAKPEKVWLFLSSAHIRYQGVGEVNPIVDYYYGNFFSFTGLKDIPMFKFRWLFIENIKKLLSSAHRNAKVVKGQLQIKSIVPDNTSKKSSADSCWGNVFYNGPGYEYMWKIAELCKKEGIEIQLFEMPCWKEFRNNCPDIIINKKMGNLNCQVKLHNLNNENIFDSILNPQTDWLSKNHLNYNGSVKVTKEIIRLFPDLTRR